MLRVKITELGKLNFLDDGGLVCLVTSDERPTLDESLCLASFQWGSLDPIDLVVGDLVSHYEHGVARYCGCKSLNEGDREKRYLVLQFAHGAHLYVPTNRRDLVRKLSVDCALTNLNAKGGKWPRSYCIEVLPNSYEWPGIPPFPKLPQEPECYLAGVNRHERLHGREASQRAMAELMNEWRLACAAYQKALHGDASYRQAAQEYFERQSREPQPLLDWWVYRAIVLRVGTATTVHNRDEGLLLIKQFVLRRERTIEKTKREVETLENCRNLEGVTREPIPEHVRLFVWRRDKGQCVRCGSRERLEFDHIIPVVAGGSSTERNI